MTTYSHILFYIVKQISQNMLIACLELCEYCETNKQLFHHKCILLYHLQVRGMLFVYFGVLMSTYRNIFLPTVKQISQNMFDDLS